MAEGDLHILTDPIGIFPCSGCHVNLDLSERPAFSMIKCPACGIVMQVPARMGGFVLVELLGAGGMGNVYRARDESLNRDVAIKIMRKNFGETATFVETFRREAQTAAQLHHPNVVLIHSFGEFKEQPFIVMELVTGGSLDRLIATGEPLDQGMVMRIGMEIASALQSGYQMQLVHGDIKPENILLDEKGASKLVDFGIAHLAGISGSNEVWGTPYYVAPEKVRCQRTDCRADIYSLGGTLYHALAGKPPFDGPDATAVVKARFQKPAPPLRDLRTDIDPEIESIVARMLQVEQAMRYPTYESLLGDMRRFLDRAGPGLALATKKVILKKRSAGPTGAISTLGGAAKTASVASTGACSVTGKVAVGTGKGSTDSPPDVSAAKGAGLATSSKVLMCLASLLLLGGLGGGIWLVAKHNSAEASDTDADQRQAQVVQASAVHQIDDCLWQAQAARSNLVLEAGAASQLCEAANKAVTEVLPDAHEMLIPLRASPPAPAGSGTNAVAAESTPAPVDPVHEETLKEPALVKVREMYRVWYRVDDIAAEATALCADITTVKLVATNTPAELLTRQASGFAERIPLFVTGKKSEEVRRNLALLRTDLSAVSNRVQVIRKHQEKLADLARQQAQQEQDQQAAVKREADRLEKSKTEIAAIQALEKSVAFIDSLHRHDYPDARRQLHVIYSSEMEAESRKAYALAMQRVQRLEELRDFMIAHVPGYQFPDGRKVESADKGGLVLAGPNGTVKVSWGGPGDIPGDVRMVILMRHFLLDEEMTNSLKPREHARLLVSAALYCRKFIPESKPVQDLAGRMLEKAVAILPTAREDVDQLLPGDAAQPDPAKPAVDATAK